MVALLIAGVVVALDDGDELHELRADFIAQELIHARALALVGGVHRRQDVVVGLMLLQQAQARHDLVEGGIAALVDAVVVMHIGRPIEADAQQEIVGGEKLAPVVVQRDRVGLQARW